MKKVFFLIINLLFLIPLVNAGSITFEVHLHDEIDGAAKVTDYERDTNIHYCIYISDDINKSVDKNFNGIYGGYEFKEGQYCFEIKDNELITFSDLPNGIYYGIAPKYNFPLRFFHPADTIGSRPYIETRRLIETNEQIDKGNYMLYGAQTVIHDYYKTTENHMKGDLLLFSDLSSNIIDITKKWDTPIINDYITIKIKWKLDYELDADKIEQSLEVKGVNEQTIIEVLLKYLQIEQESREQHLNKLKQTVLAKYGASLDAKLKKALAGHLEEYVLEILDNYNILGIASVVKSDEDGYLYIEKTLTKEREWKDIIEHIYIPTDAIIEEYDSDGYKLEYKINSCPTNPRIIYEDLHNEFDKLNNDFFLCSFGSGIGENGIDCSVEENRYKELDEQLSIIYEQWYKDLEPYYSKWLLNERDSLSSFFLANCGNIATDIVLTNYSTDVKGIIDNPKTGIKDFKILLIPLIILLGLIFIKNRKTMFLIVCLFILIPIVDAKPVIEFDSYTRFYDDEGNGPINISKEDRFYPIVESSGYTYKMTSINGTAVYDATDLDYDDDSKDNYLLIYKDGSKKTINLRDYFEYDKYDKYNFMFDISGFIIYFVYSYDSLNDITTITYNMIDVETLEFNSITKTYNGEKYLFEIDFCNDFIVSNEKKETCLLTTSITDVIQNYYDDLRAEQMWYDGMGLHPSINIIAINDRYENKDYYIINSYDAPGYYYDDVGYYVVDTYIPRLFVLDEEYNIIDVYKNQAQHIPNYYHEGAIYFIEVLYKEDTEDLSIFGRNWHMKWDYWSAPNAAFNYKIKFTNNNEEKSVKGVTDNPKTGIKNYILVVPLLLIGIFIIRKQVRRNI